jgi:hypothetical protein
MINKKYELTTEKKEINGITLFRIKALIDLKFCKAGEPGGWIEKESNLGLYDDAWVSGDALVYGDALVSGDALVHGDALVYGNALVYGDARVYGNAGVSGKLRIDFTLCSRFSFEFEWQIELWRKLEKEFEEKIMDEMKKKRGMS